MNVNIKTSYHHIKMIVEKGTKEIEVKLTQRLWKQIVIPPIVRYNKIDYICRRKHIDYLILRSDVPRCYLGLKVRDYWLRSMNDPRNYPPTDVKIVFQIEGKSD